MRTVSVALLAGCAVAASAACGSDESSGAGAGASTPTATSGAGAAGATTSGTGAASASGAGGSGVGGSGTGGNGGAPASAGTVDVAACNGIDGIAQQCSWRYSFDPAQCSPASPCDKLVAYYAGGGQDCSSYDGIMQAFASAGYVATCILLDQTLKSIADSPITQAVWSGRDLLIAGVSHGATAPVIAMARTTLDDGAHWHGSRKTAGCFYDGIYDIGAIDQLLGTGDAGGQCLAPVPHARILGRYYPTAPLVHACSNDKCFCDPDHNPKMDEDTISAVAASAFSLARFKLIECGSATPPCTGDIVPKAPIDTLCAAIDAGAAHSCELDPMPNETHLSCAGVGTGKCIGWFDALPPD
jgi:hypothetical protein